MDENKIILYYNEWWIQKEKYELGKWGKKEKTLIIAMSGNNNK